MFSFKNGYEQVKQFMYIGGQSIDNELTFKWLKNNKQTITLRENLISEEIDEFIQACNDKNFTECIDALGDILYVVYGAGISFNFMGDDSNTITYCKNNIDLNVFDCVNEIKNVCSNLNDLKFKYKNLTIEVLNCNELFTAFDLCKQLRNTLIEIECYVIGTALCLFGVDIYACFNEIHRSNMTKFCTNIEDAGLTLTHYNQTERYSPEIIKIGEYYVIKNKSNGKILKSIHFENPKLNLFF